MGTCSMGTRLAILVLCCCALTSGKQQGVGDTCNKDAGAECSDDKGKPSDKYTDKVELVRQQFEAFPTPEFTQQDLERELDWYKKFSNGTGSIEDSRVEEHVTLDMISHFLFKGIAPFHSGFRVLVVGGGTGHSILYLAEQLRETDAEIVYLDFSSAAMKIAQKRAEIRGLNNIQWYHKSIEDIPSLELGKFDFIECWGVLTHLTEPLKGLIILQNLLTETGGMSLMLYSKYARTGVYQMQELMRLVNKFAKTMPEEIENTRKILKILPKTNWYKRSELDQLEAYGEYRYGSRSHDIAQAYSDTEIYDIFLTKLDTPYSIPEVYQLVENASMNFVEYSAWGTRIALKVENYVKDEELLSMILKKSKIKQEAIAELIIGYLSRYEFHISNNKEAEATFDNLENVPFMYGNTKKLKRRLEESWKFSEKESYIFEENIRSTLFNEGSRIKMKLKWPMNKYAQMFLKEVMNNKNESIGEILAKASTVFNEPKDFLLEEFRTIYTAAKSSEQMLLRHKNVPEFEKTQNNILYELYREKEEE